MTPTLTPSDLLTRHAPLHLDDSGLDDILARVRTRSPKGRRPRAGVRRIAVGAVAVAATVLAAVVLPASLRAPDSTASAIDQLALTAGSQPATEVPDGSFLHLVTVENPDGPLTPLADGEPLGMYPRTLESWTATDGDLWRYDRTAAGAREWLRFDPAPAYGTVPGMSPQELAALPTEEQELLDHLRPIVQGSLSTDEAVFVYLADALRTDLAPPDNRRAMISAMALLPHIETERTRSWEGQPCLQVRYTEPERRGGTQSVCFDEDTASLVEEAVFQDGALVFRSVVTQRDVVPVLPAEVEENALEPVYE